MFSEVPFGPFVLERRIAVGGNAEVFLARPGHDAKEQAPWLERLLPDDAADGPPPQLVIKRLLPSLLQAPEVDGLEREADLHRRIRHPNVVTVYGAGRVGNESFLALEYVDGVDAFRLMRFAQAEGRPFPPGLAVFIARRIADALATVHAVTGDDGKGLNVIHRDVTPSNIYLSIDGDVKLGDFGIARMDGRMSLPNVNDGIKGKLGYLAPEQVSGDPVDCRADLFSLSVTLGEMLIGRRIFPGSGQLAVLLAIRDGNISPLRNAASQLPAGLFPILEKSLTPKPQERYSSGEQLSTALAPFEKPSAAELREELSEWVRWARDSSRLAKNLQGRIRDSVRRMKAVRPPAPEQKGPDSFRSGKSFRAREVEPAETRAASLAPPGPEPQDELSFVVRKGGEKLSQLPFARLVEMIATGHLSPTDRVGLFGQDAKPIVEIEELARHLLPSTTGTTASLYTPGTPDFVTELSEMNMLEVLARFRALRETGALFVDHLDKGGEHKRKEVYLGRGRLLHVASTVREELLGEYLVRRGALTREHLEAALLEMGRRGTRLGDTLVELNLVDGHDLFRAIRDQGRDRVAALCTWREGRVSFYRGQTAAQIEFPLDLDLASPMMAGAIFLSRVQYELLPALGTKLETGVRHQAALHDKEELGTAPASMQRLPELAWKGVSLGEAIAELTRRGDAARVISEAEAKAALVAARKLGWVDWKKR